VSIVRIVVIASLLALPSVGLAAPSGAATGQISPALYDGMRWRLIGPFRGGRTVAAAGVPDQPNVAYVGATDGGVWRTTDFGQTWNPIFDGQPTQSIGAIAVAPSNPDIIYVGSGEGLRRPDLSTGDGVYKSTDEGRTWTHLGLDDSQQIGSIIVDPQDPNRVFVAALGHPYGPNTERGVFRSLDGGQTWQRVLYKNEDTGAIDLAFAPGDPKTVYAALWVSRRPPWYSGGEYEAPGSGLYVSHDGGDSWTPLSGGLPGDADRLGRIGIGISPSEPSRMYAWVEADDAHGGIYRSDDAGLTWRRVNSESRVWGRASDFACVTVDPNDPDRIYVANTSTYRSDDAGANFVPIKGAPGGDDYHTIWINPKYPSIFLIASDQGATISVNGGATWSSWYNQPTAQFFHVITDNRFPYWVYGGQQESGSAAVVSRSDFGEISFRDWHSVGAEEYGYIAPDPLDPYLVYGGKASRYDQSTGQLQDISPDPLGKNGYRYDRTAPLEFSPVDPHALYLGSNVVFETRDGGKSWKVISPDLTRVDPGNPPTLGVFAPKVAHRSVIYSLGLSFRNAGTIWAGTEDGLIWRTVDGGVHWSDETPAGLASWSRIASIEPSHYDDLTAYVAVNRFRVDDLLPYVYVTHDGGKTWANKAGGLPAGASVNVVREDPVRRGLLYAGTENGVFVSFDDGAQWMPLQLNLPTTSMRDLTVHGDDLIVATHGRSFWILDDVTPLRQVSAQMASSSAFLFEPEVTYRMRRDNNTDTPLPPEVPAGQNPPDGAIIDYYLSSRAMDVKVQIADASGAVVRTLDSTDRPPVFLSGIVVPTYWVQPPAAPSVQPGMHRFVWDLRYTQPDALQHDYPISAIYEDTPPEPLGPLALPGTYQVRLIVDGRAYSQPLVVKMDPRVKSSQADLSAELAQSTTLAGIIDRSYALLQNVKQSESSATGTRGASLTALDSELSELNGDASGLLVVIDGADASPTTQQTAAVEALRQRLAADALKAATM
jgi:photosystem II stability/assembly factor-like uncharacterized protein